MKPYIGKANYSKLTFENFKRYAKYYGYDWYFNTNPDPKYFIKNGYDNCRNNWYPYVYQLYKVDQLLKKI